MKSTCLLLLTAFIIPISNAQIQLGTKAGINVSNFLVFPGLPWEEDNYFRTDFYLGLNAQAELSERSFLLLELLYTQKGAEGQPEGFIGEELTLPYLNVPVLFGYKILRNLNIYMGPEIGVLLDARIKFASENADVKTYFQTFDIGLAAGISYELTKALYLETRFIEGLTPIQEGLFDRMSDGQAKYGRNRSIQFGVGYRLFQNRS